LVDYKKHAYATHISLEIAAHVKEGLRHPQHSPVAAYFNHNGDQPDKKNS
jgi:hypothetical protein